MHRALLMAVAGVGLLGAVFVATQSTTASRRKPQSMHIAFRRTGGFFAGRALEGTIDIAAADGKLMSGQYVRSLDARDIQLVNEGAKAVEGLKGDLRDPQKGADQYQYEITIEAPGRNAQKIIVGDTADTSVPISTKAAKFFEWLRNQINQVPRQAPSKSR